MEFNHEKFNRDISREEELSSKEFLKKVAKPKDSLTYFISGEAVLLDIDRIFVQKITEYIEMLKKQGTVDKGLLWNLNYLADLIQEKIYLNEEINKLSHYSKETRTVKKNFDEGEEWRKATTPEYETIEINSKKSIREDDPEYEFNKQRLFQIETELKVLEKDFMESYPEHLLLLGDIRNKLTENRTN